MEWAVCDAQARRMQPEGQEQEWFCGRADSGPSSDKESIVKEAKLQLKEGLKSVLMTSLCISNEDVDRLLEQAGEQGN